MIAAVVPAAGAGERFKSQGSGAPKQFIDLMGQPIYIWSLRVLAQHPAITCIVVVVPKSSLDTVQAQVYEHMETAHCAKIVITAGGATRQKSVHNGLEVLAECASAVEHVLIHDAARPLLTLKMVDEVIESVTRHGACSLAIPVTDTIKRSNHGILNETLDRAELVQIQTPQAAKLPWLLDAHRRAAAENFATTDDATILEYVGHKVHIVPGSPYNLKITNPEDLSICESLASHLNQQS